MLVFNYEHISNVISYFFLHLLGKSIFNILFSKNFSKNSVSDIEIDNFYH